MEFFKPGREFDFMGQRKFWITLSISLVVLSVLSLIWPGPNYGTDFRGGTEVEVAFNQSVDTAGIRKALTGAGFQGSDVVQVTDSKNPNHFLIRVQDVTVVNDEAKAKLRKALCMAEEGVDLSKCPADAQATEVKFSLGGDKISTRYDTDPNLETIKKQIGQVASVHIREGANNPVVLNQRDHRVEIQLRSKGDDLMTGLKTQLGANVVPDRALRVEWVGPKAGEQLRASARNSVAIAILFIMLYLALRFDVRFAPGVVIACIHDAMVVILVFVVFQKEITLSTISAVLTIVGYSMNDTVVIYDRIRENLSRHRGKTFAQIINLSVSETLSRTLLTSGATLLSVLPFLIWGTGVIKDFALAMLIGIVAGTYSSIYVAAPLTEWIDTKMAERAKASGKTASPMGRPARA